jgi:hypothetical protein
MMYLITSADCFLQSAQLSMYSPFEVSKKHRNVSESQARSYFEESTAQAMKLIKNEKVLA